MTNIKRASLFDTIARERSQFMTPEWIAEALIEKHFAYLLAGDVVVEPSCGRAAFLKAIPPEIEIIGVEIDPDVADEARAQCDRRIIVGDFRFVELPSQLAGVVGNPPFKTALILQFLSRAHKLLREEGVCGFIVPAYFAQNHHRVVALASDWSSEWFMIPKHAFSKSMRAPLAFMRLIKDKRHAMIGGLTLYFEAVEVDNLSRRTQKILREGIPYRSAWRAVVETALGDLGGEASLDDIYRVIEPKRPTQNTWWREKVRQSLQRYCESVKRGVWRLKDSYVNVEN